MKVGLICIFNHPHLLNLDLMDELYGKRFSNILYLMPHEKTSRNDVFTVWGGSYTFQAFLLQARRRIVEMNCDTLVFVQDDVLLRPDINESNIEELTRGFNSFIPNLSSLSDSLKSWSWASRTLWSISNPRNTMNGSGLKFFGEGLELSDDIKAELTRLSIPTDLQFKRPDLEDRGVSNINLFDDECTASNNKKILSAFYDAIFKDGDVIKFQTPLVYGVSDFFIVNKIILEDFFDKVGLMTSAGLFAEVAIPSALIYSEGNKIRKARDCNYKVVWSFGAERENVYNGEYIKRSFEDKELLLVHPMKWSRLVRDKKLKNEWMSQVFAN